MVSLKNGIIASATIIQSINLSKGSGTNDKLHKMVIQTFASFKKPSLKLITREAHTSGYRNLRSAYVSCMYNHVKVLRSIIWYDASSTETAKANEELMQCGTRWSEKDASDESLISLDIPILSRHVSTFIEKGDKITGSDLVDLVKLTDDSLPRLEKREHYDPELLAMKV
uniref:AlNc14C133G7011 protein n=1 Tax=Albugo laibachii Nc14 TaxID=890382 RepID=F0WKF9_9STRA|nr:AlNc14C133G7011 [Albugo laibachii Nc14]|eukprot:CCA21763.1 AlNc14C133G7011 [Albugo laibachii Nc14]